MSVPKFYCRVYSGSDNFSIKEYNETARALELTDLSERDKMNILHPDPCNVQCDTCKVDVAKRQLQTKRLSYE